MVSYSKIKNIRDFNGDQMWEKINYFDIYELDSEDNFIDNTKIRYSASNFSDSNYVHSNIIKLKNNKKYGFNVNISCNDSNYRKVYMCFNYLDIMQYKNYSNNIRNKYGNHLNKKTLDWTTNSNDKSNNCPNLLYLFENGDNNWKFRLKLNNIIDGNYIFGFMIKFADFNLVNPNKCYGSRLLFSLNISNTDNLIEHSLIKKKYNSTEVSISTNTELVKILRREYLNDILLTNDYTKYNNDFYKKL